MPSKDDLLIYKFLDFLKIYNENDFDLIEYEDNTFCDRNHDETYYIKFLPQRNEYLYLVYLAGEFNDELVKAEVFEIVLEAISHYLVDIYGEFERDKFLKFLYRKNAK